MAQQDLIYQSIKSLWAAKGGNVTIPPDRIYTGRVQPDVPPRPWPTYMTIQAALTETEQITDGTQIATYMVEFRIYNCQQNDVNDPLADAMTYQRLLTGMMDAIPVNHAFYLVSGFLHAVSETTEVPPDPQTVQGVDVWVSVSSWSMLIQE